SDGPSNTTTGAAHAGTCPGGSTYQCSSHVISSGSYADNFHIYSIQWQPDHIAWYVDGIQFLQVTPSSYPSNINWPFNSNDWYLMFNLAITSSGPNSNTVFPSQIEIDWVRIYENIGGVSGCTDSLAQNYNPNATNDNGSCEYLVSFEVNLNCATNINSPSVVYITGPAVNWSCNIYALNDSNSDGIWTGEFVLPNGSFEYIYCTDGWTDSESSGLITEMQNGASCAPITDYSTYANRIINITIDTSITNVWGSCSLCIGGCTSTTATNYNANADYDDGSCNYNTNFNVTFQVDMNNVSASFTTPEVNGTFNNWCGNCWGMSDVNNDNIWDFTASVPAGSYEYKFASDNWTIQENLLNAGNCVVSAWGFTNRVLNITSDTVISIVCWESCTSCPSVSCGAITGVNMTDIIHDRATFNWDDMNSATCDVDQIRIRYREVGTNVYSTKTMGAPVGNNAPALNTSKRILNLSASTQYEYDFKIWYQDGTVVSWHVGGTFTTAAPCDNVTNVTATPTQQAGQANFCWTNPTSHAFVRLKYREDIAGSSFTNIGGMGVMAPATCKTKNGIATGLSYRAMYRTWCNPNGGPYRSAGWDGPVLWTQTSPIRVEGGTTINNLDVYPNPSRDIFNVSFTSEDVQDLDVRIINVIGEVVYTENLNEFVGEYTKQVDLSTYTKGVYFLEITTDNGVINKKAVLY
ncbi:MAG: T9SS type A sorting domain-containing protein, partial [Flavobacteriales bacterium]|nr:T9SS type A sorting domain-containing protein [Flavobacteriales bacterium]